MDTIAEIKKAVKDKKVVVGTEQTIKGLKMGKIKKVFLTSNCPKSVREDIETYSRLTSCQVEGLNVPNDELGVICKKQFAISVLGML